MKQNVLWISFLVMFITLFSSCSFMEKDQGKYSAFIFKVPQFRKGQSKELIKQRHIQLMSEGCGLLGVNLEKHYEILIPKYKERANNQLVGLADIEITSYLYFIGITAIPCLRVTAVPLVVL